jgi:TolA-binding protein
MALSPDNPALTNGAEAQPDQGSAPPAPQSPDEVEAIWRNRFSQRDRAHNAEVESLRQQMETLQRSVEATQQGGQATNGGEPSYKMRYEQTQRELEVERQARQTTERRLRFPALAGEVAPDDPLWVSARDETLARLNATFGAPPPPEPTGHVDMNNPARATVTAKPIGEMTKDELLAELQRLAPGQVERDKARLAGSGF